MTKRGVGVGRNGDKFMCMCMAVGLSISFLDLFSELIETITEKRDVIRQLAQITPD